VPCYAESVTRFAPLMLLVASACGAELRGESSRSVIAPDGGLSAGAVHEVVRTHVPAVRACYERFAKAEGRPMGVVRFRWNVEPSGAVTSAQVVATTLHSSSIEGCIADELVGWPFPASPRTTEIAEYPFTF